MHMRDVLVVVDVINNFAHDDGGALLESFRSRLDGIRSTLVDARASGTPVVYVNDAMGRWDGDAPGVVQWAIETGAGADVVAALAPDPQDSFLFKARYSAFDHTALDLLLAELECERILLCGAATEGCVVQTGLDAREHGWKVTILARACATTNPELERLALSYAEHVGGIRVSDLD
jgi:nicotinamidase-related amidase